jgi:hypothetical protein
MSSPLSVTLSGRHVTLTPLAIDDVRLVDRAGQR